MMKKDSSDRINGDDLLALGYPSNHLIGMALQINEKRLAYSKKEMLRAYTEVLGNPESYFDHVDFSLLAKAIYKYLHSRNTFEEIELRVNSEGYSVFGAAQIEAGAHQQMEIAMQLPISMYGALMPDAHQGYGLPIGGVLATKNAVIPYGVGVDIGCRMALSVFDISAEEFEAKRNSFKKILLQNTKFGAGNGFNSSEKSNHDVLDRNEFRQSQFIHQLLDKAWSQLGSSGGGNHFVEWGIIDLNITQEKHDQLPSGKFLAVLSHSGSRGLGATIANHFTKIAMKKCVLPKQAQHLAYFDLDSAEGQEYWSAMNLAGDYAKACHEIIHHKIKNALGQDPIYKVDNHHNFAWKETIHGEEYIVHRKGATPANKESYGIIPGSMTQPGFLVKGKGNAQSLYSASHGAGRQMSRTQANKIIEQAEIDRLLSESGVDLIGGGKDEAPQAYKNIHEVMHAQQDLVEVLGVFYPKIVRMADDGSKED